MQTSVIWFHGMKTFFVDSRIWPTAPVWMTAARPVFKDLLFWRSECAFFAFDLLFLNGKGSTTLALIERKAMLKKTAEAAARTTQYRDGLFGISLSDYYC
jgi:hypothetical protein